MRNVTWNADHSPRALPQLPPGLEAAGRGLGRGGLHQAAARPPLWPGQGGGKGFWIRHQVKGFLPYPISDENPPKAFEPLNGIGKKRM